MKKLTLALASALLVSGCALLSPYSITFTTPDGAVVDPAVDTLDLALNQPAMAYISDFQCGDTPRAEILPIVNDTMLTAQAHNLSLNLFSEEAAGTECQVGVTAFDRSTTASTHAQITLFILELPNEENETNPAEEEAAEEVSELQRTCEEEGGTYNACDSACEDDAEVCIEMCVETCEYPEEEANLTEEDSDSTLQNDEDTESSTETTSDSSTTEE